MVRIRSCLPSDTAHLVRALNECLYAGYRFRVHMTPEKFARDARLHDVDYGSTQLAMQQGEPVGITLVARRGETAWIGGMGVHPTLRNRGLGKALLTEAKARLGQIGVRTVLLEVLTDNDQARRCYEAVGFAAQQRYYCFRGTAAQAGAGGRVRISRWPASKLLDRFDRLHQAAQSWQRDLPTLRHKGSELAGHCLERDGEPYAALLTSESVVSDVGWQPGYLPLGLVLADLLHAALGPARPFAIINVPDDDPLCAVMGECGYEVYAEQIHMRCAL